MVIVFPKKYEYIYLSIVLMYVSIIIDTVSDWANINFPVLRYMLLFATLVFYIKGIRQTPINGKMVAKGQILIFYLFLAWTVIMFLMSADKILDPDRNYIVFKQIISGKLFLYAVPFIVFSNPSEYLIKNINKLCFNLCIFLLLIIGPVIFISGLQGFEAYGAVFGGGVPILVLTYLYHSKGVRWVSFFSLLLILFINAVNARRNQIVYFGAALLFAGLIPLLSQSSFVRKRKKLIIISFVSFCFMVFLFVVINISKFTYLIERSKTGLESREDFLEEFFEDFNAHPMDWVTGRGVLGDFKSVIYEKGADDENRSAIENGYLDHIMRGGYIYILLLIIIAVPAIFKGFFQSNNLLCKGFAALILIYFIDMIGFGVPYLSMKYVLIWLGISVCYSKQMRSYSDEYLKNKVGIKFFI